MSQTKAEPKSATDATEAASSSGSLGPRLKAMRQEKRWTLEQLAELTGLAISTLSKIENEQVSASFDTIVKIAHAYGFSFTEFFSGQKAPSRQSVAGRRTFTRAGQGLSFTTPNYDYNVHSSDLTRKGMIPLIMRIKARQVPPPLEWSNHEGEEFIYVTRGTAELHTEYYAPLRLGPGDSAYIDSTMRHAFIAVGDEDAEMLSICMTELLFFDDVAVGNTNSKRAEATG